MHWSGPAGDASASSDEGNVDSFAGTGDAGTDGRDGSKGGNVEFEWKVEEGESSGDTFDFKVMEESEAAGSQITKVKVFICPSDVGSIDGDGMDDLATYQQIDPASDGTSLPTVPVVDLQLDQHFEILV